MFYIRLTSLLSSRDSILLFVLVLAGFPIYKMLFLKPASLLKSHRILFITALIFAPFGLLVLIKGTLFISCAAVAGICFLFLIWKKFPLHAIICLVIPILSMMSFWSIAGKSLFPLGYYFMGIAQISAGNEAISVIGNNTEIIIFLSMTSLIFSFIGFNISAKCS